MLTKNAKYRVKNSQGVYEVVHLETNANQVVETEQKQFVSVNEKAEWSGKATVESVNNVQNNVNKVVEDLAGEIARATGVEQGLDERISTIEGFCLDGLRTDIDKNKADIVDLQGDLADEIAARESANALINEELGRKADISDLEAEITRATNIEQGLDTRLSDVETKVDTNENNIAKNAQAIEKEIVDRQIGIARVEELVATERQRAEGAEEVLQANIDKKVSKEDFNAEQTRVNNALAEKVSNEVFVEEQEKVEGLFDQVNTTLEGHGTLIEAVTALAQENKEKKADKDQVANDILVGVGQAKSYADGKLVEAKSYADGKLVEAKAYTDEEIVKVGATITDLEAAYKAADVEVLNDAKAHADKAVADLVDSAPETLNTLKELADALTEHEDEYESLLEVVGSKANAADVYNKTEVDGIKTSLQASITKVETDYKVADVALDGRLKTVEGITSGVGAIRSELDEAKQDIVTNTTEIAGCKTSIAANTNAITKEVDDRKQADNALDVKITTEKERALAAESNLDGKITTVNQELETTKEDVVANTNAIAQEAANRQSAINTLDSKINNTLPVTSSVQPADRAEGHVWIEILN